MIPNDAAELIVEIAVPEGVSDEEVLATIEKLSLGVNELHRTIGGKGLKVKRLTIEATTPHLAVMPRQT